MLVNRTILRLRSRSRALWRICLRVSSLGSSCSATSLSRGHGLPALSHDPGLVGCVGQQGQVSRSFDLSDDASLHLGRDLGFASREDATSPVEEARQQGDVLVVDLLDAYVGADAPATAAALTLDVVRGPGHVARAGLVFVFLVVVVFVFVVLVLVVLIVVVARRARSTRLTDGFGAGAAARFPARRTAARPALPAAQRRARQTARQGSRQRFLLRVWG